MKITWLEKIKKMNEYEMAHFILTLGESDEYYCMHCAYFMDEKKCGHGNCQDGIVEFLQSKIDEKRN